jgi:type VI secretion system protein ImpC
MGNLLYAILIGEENTKMLFEQLSEGASIEGTGAQNERPITSTGELQRSTRQAPAATAKVQEVDILKGVLMAAKENERSRAEKKIRALVSPYVKGESGFDRYVYNRIDAQFKSIDISLSKQLRAIMHHPQFRRLEGTWRGISYLLMNTETSDTLKIRVLNVSKRELFNDLDKAVEFDQSQIFKKLYESEFGHPGGEPYGAVLGDFEFSNQPEDIDLLQKMSNVAAAAFCPFISAADPKLLRLESWQELSRPRDLEKAFTSIDHTRWNAFRESEDSRFVVLVMPRVLARTPSGAIARPVEEFEFEELDDTKPVSYEDFTWMNAAYVLGARLTDAFAKYGSCTAIRGAEGGGRVDGLPTFVFTSDDGDKDLKCPTEIGITDRREWELSKLGFLALCHYKDSEFAVFFNGHTVQKPKKYDHPEATANAAISARLPCIMATSRFAHYLRILARDKISSFMERAEAEYVLNRWIDDYVDPSETSSQETRTRYPLREAKVEVREVPGQPGTYNAIAWIRPWLQGEELTTAMRLVVNIPKTAG